MHVIARARIRAAKKRRPQAASAREAWDRSMTVTDKVGRFPVFGIGGNKIRLIAVVQYKFKKL
jgi:mRNA interferase HigB